MRNYRIWICVLLFGLAVMPACAWLESLGPPSQAQLKALETRTLDAPFDMVYSAATEALFDLGYQITHSEKASGVIVGERRKTETELVETKDPKKLFEKKEHTTVFSLTLLIRPAGKKTIDVRIKTSVNGEARLDKGAIDQVWLYIDRQILMDGVPQEDTTKGPEPLKRQRL